MDTAIRTKRAAWRNILLVAAGLAAQTASLTAAGSDIYVTTGPDGIETFSNLPRESTAFPPAKLAPVLPKQILLTPAKAVQPDEILPLAESSIQIHELAASGKSFLLND